MYNVEQLRKSGHKVMVHHRRVYKNGVDLCARGGYTEVFITTPEGKNLFGYAKCSDRDNFCKSLGVKIAIGRSLTGN